MYDTVLVPVDGSDESMTAAKEAVRLTADGGTLHILSVVEELPMYRRSRKAQKFEGDTETEEDEAKQALKRAEEFVDTADIECVSTVENGVPRQVIVTHAEEVGADAIVVGKRGQSEVADDVLGSTTERVIRKASVPVVSVPTT